MRYTGYTTDTDLPYEEDKPIIEYLEHMSGSVC